MWAHLRLCRVHTIVFYYKVYPFPIHRLLVLFIRLSYFSILLCFECCNFSAPHILDVEGKFNQAGHVVSGR